MRTSSIFTKKRYPPLTLAFLSTLECRSRYASTTSSQNNNNGSDSEPPRDNQPKSATTDTSVHNSEPTNVPTGAGGKEGQQASANPPPPARQMHRGKDHFMLELEKAERAAAQAAKPKPNAVFLSTLEKIRAQNAAGVGEESADASTASGDGSTTKKKRAGFFSSAAAAERKEKKKAAMASERQKLLVFRDVGMDLDKAILSRDILLIPKYFYYGMEYAIDNELERMLRYFNEHAINELKLMNDGKLIRGMERLAKEGFLFPTIGQTTPIKSLVKLSDGSGGGESKTPSSSVVVGGTQAIPYGNKDVHTSVSPMLFRKPTLVIYSQLGQKVGGQADRLWRELALSYSAPTFASTKLNPKMKITTSKDEAAAVTTDATAAGAGVVTTIQHTKPLDVLSLRSLDVQNYQWVHRLYVRRFIRSLLDNTYHPSTAPSTSTTTTNGAAAAIDIGSSASEFSSPSSRSGSVDASVVLPDDVRRAYNDWLLNTTMVGNKFLQPFFPHGVRNYLSPYVFLVDHRGRVRWMSSGLPDAKERALLPKLFQQLGLEYFRDR